MISTPVKVEYNFVPKSRWEGPNDTWYVKVFVPAYRDDGSMYPFLVDVKSVDGKSKKKLLEKYIEDNYNNIVEELDATPLIAQLF